jgi:hypothetical protein
MRPGWDRSRIGWLAMTRHWRVPEGVALRVWQGLGRSAHPEAVTFRFAVGNWDSTPGGRAKLVQFLTQWPPTRLMVLIENVSAVGWVSRQDATTVQEAILAQTDARGQWCWLGDCPPPFQGGRDAVFGLFARPAPRD